MPTNIRFQGLVKTTAEIESDKFAGRIGWNTTLARFVAYYNSTQYAQMARRDVLETFAAGIQDSTLGVGLPMFAGTAGRLSTESVANFRSRIGAVNKAGDTMTGGLTLSAGNLNVGAGAIQTAGVTRISNGGAGTLTTLSTTGLATLNSLNVTGQAGTGSRMVQAGADGTQSASIPVPSAFAQTLLDDADAATARTTLGAQQSAVVYSSGSDAISYVRIASITMTASFSTYSTTLRASNRRGSFDLYVCLSKGPTAGVAYEENAISVGVGTPPAWRIKRTVVSGTSITWDIYFITNGYAQYVWVSRANTLMRGTMDVAYPGDATTTDPGSDVPVYDVWQNSIPNWNAAYDHSQATGNPHGTTFAQIASIPASIDAIDGLTPAADRIAYYTGANSAALSPLSAFGRSLIDDADAAAARATIEAQSFATEYDSQTIAFTSNYNSPISPIHTFPANFFSKNKTVRIVGRVNSGDLVGKQLKLLVDGVSSFPLYTPSTGEQGFLFEIFIKCLTAPSSGNVDLLITGRITSSSTKLSESTITTSYAVGSAHTIGISVDNAGASGSVGCYMWTVEQLSKGA